MTSTFRGLLHARRVAGVAALASLLASSGAVAFARPGGALPNKALVGTWFVRVTLRNCETNSSLGTFNSLVTFHQGGTLSEATSSTSFAIGQRSPGQGTWSADEHDTYSQRFVSLINFDTAANLPGMPGFDPARPVTPGFFAGWATVTHALTMVDENHATSAGTNDFYKSDGTLYRTGCSTAESTRFE